MKEITKKRLGTFARWWALSMVLFISLSIGAVIAAINDSRNLMTLAILGTCVMLPIQFGQLVAAIIVRRWWCVAGCVLGIALSIFVMLCCMVALAAGQYRPPHT